MTSPAPISNARAYFDRLRSLGEAAAFAELEQIPADYTTNPHFEEEWLDFKGRPNNDDDAKKIWSKALSGYANITDGLIIWGIDARKTPPRDIDAASGLRLVTEPRVLESKLRDWVRDATNPPVMAVEYLSLVGPNGEGFVVCLIPESTHKPHRAEWSGRHYYYRAGDDFLETGPSLLRVLFYPQLNVRFKLETTLWYQHGFQREWDDYKTFGGNHLYNKILNSAARLWVKMSLHNIGNATAKDCYVRVKLNNTSGASIRSLMGYWGASEPHRPNEIAFNCKIPIHPGQAVELPHLQYDEPFGVKPAQDGRDELLPQHAELKLELFLYAEGISQQTATIVFPPNTNFSSAQDAHQVVDLL